MAPCKRSLTLLALAAATLNFVVAAPTSEVASASQVASTSQVAPQCSQGLYPDIAETSNASPQARQLFTDYFTTKSEHYPAGFLETWNPNQAEYLDSTLGFTIAANRSALVKGQEYEMGQWNKSAPNGRSYPLRILGDTVGGAMVYYVDTPSLFGAEIRTISSFDFLGGKIRRQLDNWNGRGNAAKTLLGSDKVYPYDLGLQGIPELAAPRIQNVSHALQGAFSTGNSTAAAMLFSYDAVLEDLTLSARIEGSIAIGAYLDRALGTLPWGKGAEVTHVLGSDVGGGYEWRPVGDGVRYGVAALELDCFGQVTRFTAVWDGSRVSESVIEGLAALTPMP